jgi:serine/threonine protein kinase
MPSNEMKLNDAKLTLGNFGVSFRPDDKSRFESFTPLVLRPPEARFEPSKPLTLASDIWSLGCVMFELLAHRSLIDGSFLASQDDITAQQVELQGICRRSGGRGGRNDRSGMMTMERRLSRPAIIWPWERRFERWAQDPGRAKGMDAVGMEQRDAVLDLLKTMLAWKPSGRPDIMTIMESEWMTKWALPAYEESLGEQ